MAATVCRICVLVVACMVGIARSSSADPVVIYSNFGPAPGYLQGTWENPFLNPQAWMNSDENAYYMGFQLSEAASLTSITLPVVWARTLPDGFSVSVWTSSGGAPNFTTTGLLERIVRPVPGDAQPRNVSMLTFESALQPMLSANTLYFLGGFATGSFPDFEFSDFATLWPWNNAGIQGTIVDSTAGGVFVGQGTLGAFQLNGALDPVPEPATMLLFATGAGFLLQRARAHRRS